MSPRGTEAHGHMCSHQVEDLSAEVSNQIFKEPDTLRYLLYRELERLRPKILICEK